MLIAVESAVGTLAVAVGVLGLTPAAVAGGLLLASRRAAVLDEGPRA